MLNLLRNQIARNNAALRTFVGPRSSRLSSRKQIATNLFRHTRRQYSSQSSPSIQGFTNHKIHYILGTTVVVLGGAYAFSNLRLDNRTKTLIDKELEKLPEIHLKHGSADQSIGLFTPTPQDYQNVYNAIANQLWEKDEYDDGSYGPVILRLAWHASGSYDAKTGSGGSNGATMRFAPEGDLAANAGLKNARDFLEPIKEAFPWISYSDLWTLSGVCAVQEMQGPRIRWRPGRTDKDIAYCSPDGRLPDGSKEQNHLRAIFGRMGFNDQEIVALSGAHALGRCHTDRSGFEGPWTFSPTVLTNEYYKLLSEEAWNWRDWKGNRQYQDGKTKSLMMLPTDMALIEDDSFKEYVNKYANDSELFFEDFSNVVTKLFELGVPFKTDERMELKTLEEQEVDD